MKISLIIPTYNAQSYLPKLLSKLKEQSIEFELIIIDSSSTDMTPTIAQEYVDKFITIPKNEFDHGGTRTKAAKQASGDIVLYLTQDALPVDRYAIERIVKVFEDDAIGAAYGRQLAYEESSLFGKHLRIFNYPETSHLRTLANSGQYGIKSVFLSDSFAAYRVTALREIDWIKDGLISSEDSYAGAKMLLADYTLAYVADAQVYHSHSYTILEEFRRYFDIGVFYNRQKWIQDRFGKAEGEGKRYIISELKYLIKNEAYLKIPEFFIRNAMKYIGYKLGQQHKKFSPSMIQKMTMHPLWWKKINYFEKGQYDEMA